VHRYLDGAAITMPPSAETAAAAGTALATIQQRGRALETKPSGNLQCWPGRWPCWTGTKPGPVTRVWRQRSRCFGGPHGARLPELSLDLNFAMNQHVHYC
jgi:hypothetical protein